jgi:alpha-galactosidase
MMRIAGFALAAAVGSRPCVPPEVETSKPVKVFILAGQSNMEGHAKVTTFDSMARDPVTAPILKEMRQEDGTPRVCEKVWISYLHGDRSSPEGAVKQGRLTAGYGAQGGAPKIGPEFTFGIYMQKLLDEPIVIIKTAWGGKSLHTDFRPPSAGAYEPNEQQLALYAKQGKDVEKIKEDNVKASGRYYRAMIDHVRKVLKDLRQVCPEFDPRQGYELAGFVWFQGWNDMVDSQVYPDRKKPGGYDHYSRLLGQFIRDVRKDLEAPRLPFVIGVMGVGGIQQEPNYFRQAMAAPAELPEFKGNVINVLTEKYWDAKLGELVARGEKLSRYADQVNKDPNLSREQRAAAVEKFKAELFTPEELKLKEEGASNAAYHYLGSAKILAQIGKAFAEAMVEVRK